MLGAKLDAAAYLGRLAEELGRIDRGATRPVGRSDLRGLAERAVRSSSSATAAPARPPRT